MSKVPSGCFRGRLWYDLHVMSETDMSSKNGHVVITSNFPPTVAARRFAKLSEYELIVVGDRKTPAD